MSDALQGPAPAELSRASRQPAAHRHSASALPDTLLPGLAATALAALAYFALQGELPYHDSARFISQVASGQPDWDIGHILLQPTALLLATLTGAKPMLVLKAFSSLSTAVAVGLFHVILLRQGLSRWTSILGTILLAGSCSVLTLAPSAHPKLAAFPFINGALLCLIEAERGTPRANQWRLLGAVLLATGGAFLASVLATVPFVALATLVQARRSGLGWQPALARSATFAAAAGATFLLIVAAAFPAFTGQALSVHGVIASVSGKAGLRPPPIPLPVHAARAVFGTVQNLIVTPGLGATIQAWMRGQIPSLHPYLGLLPTFLTWLLTAAGLAAIYARTALSVIRRRTFPIPLAFLCGAQLWSIWYGLVDPEHWFQLTAPTLILLLTLFRPTLLRPNLLRPNLLSIALPVATFCIVGLNLALFALPVATYPMARNEAQLARLLTPDDLLLTFISYPGRAYVGFFNLPNVHTLAMDTLLTDPATPPGDTLHQLDTDIGATLRQGGRVIVADALDPLDWEAPWMLLLSRGVTKASLHDLLLHNRTMQRLDDVGGIKLWELAPTAAAR